MRKHRNPVKGKSIPFPLACIDIDPKTGLRTGSLCNARQEAHPKEQRKPFFKCPNRGARRGNCSTHAFLYPRRWERKKKEKGNEEHDETKKRRFHVHQGIDIFADSGTDIHTVTAGTVHTASGTTWMRNYGGYGLVVVIKSEGADGKPLFFLDAHCDEVLVKKGDVVPEGHVIAKVGTTAYSREFPAARFEKAHLHFEVSTKEYPLSPSDKRAAGEPSPTLGRLDPREVLESLGPWGMTKVHIPSEGILTRKLANGLNKRVELGTGGFFPLGANNLWHGGIHLRTPLGSTLIAPFDATIVAARLDPDPDFANRADGSTNFILLRHEIPETYFALFQGASPEEVKPKPVEIRDRAVGRKKRCANRPEDVIAVKNKLFERAEGYYEPQDPTDLDDGSRPSKALKAAIKSFQDNEVTDINPDGIVDIPGQTWTALHHGAPPKEPTPTDDPTEPSVNTRRVLYSLLMHLEPLAITNKLAKDFPWLAEVELQLDPEGPDPTEEEAKKAEETRKREHDEDIAEAAYDLKKAVGAPNAELLPAENLMPDVYWVHQRLVRFGFHPGPAKVSCDEALISAIREFQNQHHGTFKAKKNGDGRVDPNGGTVALLRKPKAELLRGSGGKPGPKVDPVFVHRTTERDDDGVANVITGLDVKVSSGDPLWRSGQSMAYAATERPVLEMREQIHWEIFSEHLIVRGLSEDLFARAWEDPIIDTNEDMTSDVPKRLMDSIESASPEFDRDGVLALGEIRDLYNSGRGKSLRRTPCRFISQWALDVDNAVAELGKLDYDTKGLARRLRPLMWWDQAADVLPSSRLVWHYNPIELLADYAEHLASMRPPEDINSETHPTLIVRVLYANGTGMPDATVELLYGIEVKRSATTHASGEAEFIAVEVGDYGVRITAPTITAPIAVQSESVTVTLAKREKKAPQIVLPRPFAILRMTLKINDELGSRQTMEIRKKGMGPVSKETDDYGRAVFELPVGGGYTAWVGDRKRGVSVKLESLNEFTLKIRDKDIPGPEPEQLEGMLAVMVVDEEHEDGLGDELVFVFPRDERYLAVQQYTNDEELAAFELPAGEYLVEVRDESIMRTVTPWSTTSVEMEIDG